MSERTKAKRVILELIRQAGGEFVGMTRLYKAFYVAHLLYAENEPGFLTTWPIVRMPHGPGIESGEDLLVELELTGLLDVERVREGPWTTARYKLTDRGLASQPLDPAEQRAVREAVEFVQSKSAVEVSELTHEHSRSWLAARDGQVLNIYIDMIPDDEFRRRERELDALHRDVMAAWK